MRAPLLQKRRCWRAPGASGRSSGCWQRAQQQRAQQRLAPIPTGGIGGELLEPTRRSRRPRASRAPAERASGGRRRAQLSMAQEPVPSTQDLTARRSPPLAPAVTATLTGGICTGGRAGQGLGPHNLNLAHVSRADFHTWTINLLL